jgi:deoxyuridine 5'-triphosphate nucleotidohydrolase
MFIKVKTLVKDAKIPTRGSTLSAGYDLYSSESTIVKAGDRSLISTGLAIQVPPECYGRIASRSGLAVKHGIDVGAGVIDADYIGHVKVLLFNHGKDDFYISKGDRIAQLIIEKIAHLDITITEELTKTTRGISGFGSTGLN